MRMNFQWTFPVSLALGRAELSGFTVSKAGRLCSPFVSASSGAFQQSKEVCVEGSKSPDFASHDSLSQTRQAGGANMWEKDALNSLESSPFRCQWPNPVPTGPNPRHSLIWE